MAIDGIGKGPGVGPGAGVDGAAGPEGTHGAKATESTGKVFEVGRSESTTGSQAVQHVQMDGTSPLARLQARQIDVNQYLDLKVEAATSHLQGLSSDEMSAVRRMLRDTLATDPTLMGLVRGATGQAAPGDE